MVLREGLNFAQAFNLLSHFVSSELSVGGKVKKNIDVIVITISFKEY